MSENLAQELSALGWKIKSRNPSSLRPLSPYVPRIFSLWNAYREKIIPFFPAAPRKRPALTKYLSQLTDLYEEDAYNSLSIEGYQVNEDLIIRVQNNEWNPDAYGHDLQERNALAARGYYEAFLEVKKSLKRLFAGENPGEVVESDLKKWYQALFFPIARAGIIRDEDLLGYRKGPVYIRNSRHVPLPKEALVDAMEALFECLKNEKHAAVRAVLGHYLFVFIHPYMDGNGRIGRFLMNAMFASGGYPWTIIHVKNRAQYLKVLELAGPGQTIEPFAKFVSEEMRGLS